MKITYLGQDGFLIETENGSLLTDPYLSYYVDNNSSVGNFVWKRAYAPPVKARELGNVDAVLLSHSHDDHSDPWTLGELSDTHEETSYITSVSQVDFIASLGVPKSKIIGAYEGGVHTLGDVSVYPFAAAHEELHIRSELGDGVFDELTYLIESKNEGIYVFHGGDTCLYDGLCEKIKSKTEKCDMLVMLLPVNGGSEEKRKSGIVGNMDIHDAITLAKLCGADLLIPMHHDLYPENGITNEEIISAAKNDVYENIRILAPGETLEIK